MDAANAEFKEIVSPEGVEERLVRETTFRLTMTMGGKFRGYITRNVDKPTTIGIWDTEDEAVREMGGMMMAMGVLDNDPKRAIDMFLEAAGKKGGPS